MNATAQPVTADRPNLLLVEDDDGIRRSLQLLLQGQGFNVRAFASAAPALADAAASEARYLVVDYLLADSDGIAFLRQLRARGWQGVAVLITAYASPEVRDGARDVGFVTVLDKPFRDNALIAALTR